MSKQKESVGSGEQNNKMKAALQAMEQIKGKFGEGSIMKLGDNKKMAVNVVPSGCLSLDLALGVGGLPRGRIIEIFGPEASGKTTLALYTAAEVQKKGGIAAFIDAEHALDPEYAKKIGVNVDNLIISQPDSGEQALEIVETLVRSNAVDVIIVDSVAALTPKAELEGEMGDAHMGLQARLMSQALRKLTGVIGKTNTILIFINQIRMKIGVFFGNPETTTGGTALKFYSSVRIEIRKTAQIKQGDQILGSRIKAKVVKNKVAPPFRFAEFDILFAEGISVAGDILDLGVNGQIVEKKGNTYLYKETKLGVGREQAKEYLKNNFTVLEAIRGEIWQKHLAATQPENNKNNEEEQLATEEKGESIVG